MKAPSLLVFGLSLLGFYPLSWSSPDRNWQPAQVQQIQRVPDIPPPGDHWEYVLASNGLIYTVRLRRPLPPFGIIVTPFDEPNLPVANY